MAVYPYTYKVLNRQTGRKVSVKKWRVQIRQNGENINKVFDEESLARSFEEDELKRLKMGIPQDKLIDLKYQMEMPSIASMLQKHFDDYLSKHSPNSLQTNKNRCESSIPAIPIYMADLGAKFPNYRYGNNIVNAMLKRTYSEDFIPFGDFKLDTVDFWLIMAYIASRKKSGIKDNTILKELSIVSSGFDRVYKMYPTQFPNGIINPVKMLPRDEKPKPYLGRKRVISDDEAAKIGEWLSMKKNQEPLYVFILCLESGARKSEILGCLWEHVDLHDWTIYFPKTKNGKDRTISIPDDEQLRQWLRDNKQKQGKVFKLTNWNFRQYWVDALTALDMYEDEKRRPHFHDTRRTAITKLIRQRSSNTFQIAKEMGASPQTIEQEKEKMPDRMADIFAKLRRGEALNEQEIMALAGHGSMAMTNAYYGDRN